MSQSRESALEFPCDFPIKAMGYAGDNIKHLVAEIVGRHAAPVDPEQLEVRASRGGKYVSVTVTIRATSQEQLDAIYQELSDSGHILMSL